MNSKLYIANCDNFKFENVVNEDRPYQLLKYYYEVDLLLPLLGEHQITNLSVAMTSIEVLNNINMTNILLDSIVKSIKNV